MKRKERKQLRWNHALYTLIDEKNNLIDTKIDISAVLMFLSDCVCVCVCVYLCKEKKAIKQVRLFREFITQCKRRVYGM